MKAFQRILAVLLCLVMSLGMISMVAFAATNIDASASGILTIHKYEYNGTAGTGTGTTADAPTVQEGNTNPDVAPIPLPGVTFTVYMVKNATDTIAYYNGENEDTVTVDTYVTNGAFTGSALAFSATVGTGSKSAAAGEGIEITTGEDGVATISNLPVGMYVVVETAHPDKVTDPADPFLISIPMTDPDGEDEWMYTVNVYPKNKTSQGNVTIKKTDVSGTALAGIEFKLEKQDADDTTKWNVVKNGNSETWTTDSNGEIPFSGLAHGTYRVTETKTLEGYILDNRSVEFTVTESNTITCTENLASVSTTGANSKALTITIKNEKPTIDKVISETDKNKVGVGDVIDVTVTADIPLNIAEMAVFTVTDNPTGMTVNDSDFVVKADTTELTANTHYTRADNKPDNGGFTLTFTDGALDNFGGKKLTITYKATITADAATNNTASNTVELKYDSTLGTAADPHTTTDDDDTKLYKATITKELKGGETTDSAVGNVKFVLYKDAAHQNPVYVTGSNGNYKVAESETAEGATTELVVGSGSKIVIDGLAEGTYYLVETQTVDGYNLLSGHVELKVEKEANETTNDYSVSLNVVNKKGFTLPATGGIGTLMFIIIGGVLMAGGICLIVPNKKRAI